MGLFKRWSKNLKNKNDHFFAGSRGLFRMTSLKDVSIDRHAKFLYNRKLFLNGQHMIPGPRAPWSQGAGVHGLDGPTFSI